MSQYGTTQDYCNGYDDGADETRDLHGPLVKAAIELLGRWPTNKNLTVQIQALARAVEALPENGRMDLDDTTRPEA